MKYVWFVIIVFVALFFAFTIAGLEAGESQTFGTATCYPDACFCEAIHIYENGPAQPVNTYSALIYVFIGLWILFEVLRTNEYKFYGTLFSAAMIIMGLGTILYHANIDFLGQTIDNGGIYLFATVALSYAINRYLSWSRNKILALYVLLNTTFFILIIYLPELRRWITALLVFIILALEYRTYLQHKMWQRMKTFLIGFVIFVTAFIFWALDVTKALCEPQSFWQGHAAWHILTAIALYLLYRHYKHETLNHGSE